MDLVQFFVTFFRYFSFKTAKCYFFRFWASAFGFLLVWFSNLNILLTAQPRKWKSSVCLKYLIRNYVKKINCLPVFANTSCPVHAGKGRMGLGEAFGKGEVLFEMV